jgi:hypothetical protein
MTKTPGSCFANAGEVRKAAGHEVGLGDAEFLAVDPVGRRAGDEDVGGACALGLLGFVFGKRLVVAEVGELHLHPRVLGLERVDDRGEVVRGRVAVDEEIVLALRRRDEVRDGRRRNRGRGTGAAGPGNRSAGRTGRR